MQPQGKSKFRLIARVSAACLALGTVASTAMASDIRLVVQITVDGLRGDLLSRYEYAFRPDGFRRLMDGGVWYTDAHHPHANTETIVGHATLATGAYPSEHGMIGNAWFNRGEDRLGYNIEDPDYPMLPIPGFDAEGEQVDPTQAAAQTSGRSPVNLLTTTFGDELIKSTNNRSRVFSVSGKDRSAVAMGGHAGKAFWFSTATGVFETSRYYYDAYPQWTNDWNTARPADSLSGGLWETECSDAPYLMDNEDREYKSDLKGFGRTFPHSFGRLPDGLYYTQVLLSPHGDRLTADFAQALVTAEDLGADEWLDYLSVSFSGVDATNHFFGPSSRQNEEMMRCLDQTLAGLFAFMDETVGNQHVLYVLSADHGMPEAPERMEASGFKTYRVFTEVLTEDLNALIAEEFGVQDAIKYFFRPYVYLDHEAIEAAGADIRAIERRVSERLMAEPGVAMAMPTVPLAEQRDDVLQSQIRRNYHPARSGDIYVAQAPYTFMMVKGPIAVMHGSPWRYDTHVPIIFAGPGINAATASERVYTTDVAVTLANLFGTTQPSGASGKVLGEVLE